MININLDNYPDVLRINDIKDILRIGRNRAYKIIAEIPHYKFGKIYYVTKVDLISYINNK